MCLFITRTKYQIWYAKRWTCSIVVHSKRMPPSPCPGGIHRYKGALDDKIPLDAQKRGTSLWGLINTPICPTVSRSRCVRLPVRVGNFCHPMAEAMSTGLPVIASDTPVNLKPVRGRFLFKSLAQGIADRIEELNNSEALEPIICRRAAWAFRATAGRTMTVSLIRSRRWFPAGEKITYPFTVDGMPSSSPQSFKIVAIVAAFDNAFPMAVSK